MKAQTAILTAILKGYSIVISNTENNIVISLNGTVVTTYGSIFDSTDIETAFIDFFDTFINLTF